MKKRVVTIEIDRDWVWKAQKELNAWSVPHEQYTLEGNVLTTSDNNVIDVLTETFMNAPHLITFKG